MLYVGLGKAEGHVLGRQAQIFDGGVFEMELSEVVVGGCFLEFEYDGIAADMGGRFEAFGEGVGVAV